MSYYKEENNKPKRQEIIGAATSASLLNALFLTGMSDDNIHQLQGRK